mmetsp:Transcript_3358/g.9140  ORF Transcript_3358/g.9140 Transcript_3358/m.9140 type:complete len:96 (-) Transcript_3358:470-757(-)
MLLPLLACILTNAGSWLQEATTEKQKRLAEEEGFVRMAFSAEPSFNNALLQRPHSREDVDAGHCCIVTRGASLGPPLMWTHQSPCITRNSPDSLS